MTHPQMWHSPDPDPLGMAITLAAANATAGRSPYGAVITRDGMVIAAEANRAAEGPDPTAHGEVTAIRAACQSLGSMSLLGATMFSSCEPCLMCISATLWAGIDTVIYAARITNESQGTGLFPEAANYTKTLPITLILHERPEAVRLYQPA